MGNKVRDYGSDEARWRETQWVSRGLKQSFAADEYDDLQPFQDLLSRLRTLEEQGSGDRKKS